MTETLTKNHELYISVGLSNPMKPSVFKEVVDSLLFENIGYMESWGTHTRSEYIGIIDELQDERDKYKASFEDLYNKIRSALHAESKMDAYHILTVALQEHSDPWPKATVSTESA